MDLYLPDAKKTLSKNFMLNIIDIHNAMGLQEQS